MAGTRSSSRLAGQSSSPSSSQSQTSPKATAGTKRKADTAPTQQAKRGKKGAEKEQKTIEETLSTEEPKSKTATNGRENGHAEPSDQQAREAREDAEAENADESTKEHADTTVAEQNGDSNGHNTTEQTPKADDKGNAESKDDEPMTDSAEVDELEPDASAVKSNKNAVEPGARDQDVPSSILEKGIIYFFFRARVNVNDPQDTNDIARSYMVMRPIPHGAKLSDGPIGDEGNCRLLALPKKVLPVSGKDRFMVFVEKAKTSFKELKESFMSASDYATKTAGTSHSPTVTPIGEGIYAITTTGRESHLAYMLTIPSKLDEVQKDIGLRERGSFVTSTKNPEQKGPANASLPKGPDFPKEIMDEFRNLRWMPMQPKHLDYENAQLLIIGESSGIDKATEPLQRDSKHDKETPLEEMEKLEGEDEIRVKHLKGDDAVFTDLGLSSKEYPKVLTTW